MSTANFHFLAFGQHFPWQGLLPRLRWLVAGAVFETLEHRNRQSPVEWKQQVSCHNVIFEESFFFKARPRTEEALRQSSFASPVRGLTMKKGSGTLAVHSFTPF